MLPPRRRPVTAALLLTLGATAAAAPVPNLARSILLSDAVETHGARCLDGTPQRLWLQESQSTNAANRSKWYFHFMGGGECVGLSACTARAYAPSQCYRGSSSVACFNANGDLEPGKTFNETMDFRDVPCINGARWGGGLLMNTPATNPLTHDWNKVEIVYCDGNSYAGNNDTVERVSYGGRDGLPLYFRGKRNVDAAVDYLVQHHGLAGATHFVISGDSAGGVAAFWHADYFAQRMPRARVLSVPDSGFFISYAGCTDCAGSASPDVARQRWMVEQINASAGLDQSCVAARGAAGCLLPEDVAPHVGVPLFVMNSRYDAAATPTPATAANINAHGAFLLRKVRDAVLPAPANAAFITSCHKHCGQWAQGQVLAGHDDFNVTIGGWDAPHAVDSWAAAAWGGVSSRREWVQAAHYPCPTCCDGGDPQQ